MKKIILLMLTMFIVGNAQEVGARYLIITYDEYYNDILPLANWKHKKGMRTKIARLSEIGATATQIRDYIVNAYNNWQIQPEYILFVGAPNKIPFPMVLGWNSDNYYTNMDADLYNEILSGRLTVHNTTETQTVVNKILAYERTPYMADSLWFINACLIANEDYGTYPPQGNDTVYWNDVRHAKNLMLSYGYNTIDTFSCGLGNNAAQVIESVNAGRGFVMYRGSGLNNWWTPFACNPDAAVNGSKLPLVLSFTCCCLGTGSTPAAAEKWFLTGTPTTSRGASGYFATTTVGGGSITFLRSAVSRGFFDAIFVDRVKTFGAACEGGRKRVYAMYPSGGNEEYAGFTTIGDPEMNLWTAQPCSLAVTHPLLVPVGSANVSINVFNASGMTPIGNALVCLTAKQDTMVYVLDTTDASGNAYFSFSPQIVLDTIYVTVTGRNLQPYEGYMITGYTERPFVVYLRSFVDDSIGGNNSGTINPGETINLPLWVQNCGDSTGHNITGLLRTNDIYVTMLDSVKSFGNIAGHDSAFTAIDGYDFSIAPNCPDCHTINFTLICQDADDSIWVSYFNKLIHAPEIIFLDAQISGGNGNSSLEPGETVFVAVSVKNQGSAPIDSFNAILQSLSMYTGIIDSLGSYGPIGPDSSAVNALDPFIVFADSATPQGTIVDFRTIVSNASYFDTLTFSLVIGKQDYFIWNYDPTPTPGENMHNILTALGYSGEIGSILPLNLQYYNCVLVCAGVFPNNNVILADCPEAIRLTDFAYSGGKLYLEGGDVWYYDPMTGTGHDFGPLFGLSAVADGGNDMGPIAGQSGTFTGGMNFIYGGENQWMDHIDPLASGSFLIFRDSNNSYNCGVAYNSGTYRTVGTSFELGLLTDGQPPSTRSVLLDSIMHFFGLHTGIVEQNSISNIHDFRFGVFPTPFSNVLHIRLNPSGNNKASLRIFDVSGRCVRTILQNHVLAPGVVDLTWDGRDDRGCIVSAGVYIVQFNNAGCERTKKVIFLK